MKVLVMGPPGPALDDAVAHLEAIGHDVLRCTDHGEPLFPCKGLDQSCPLDEAFVDAALVVRTRAWPRPTVFDRGVTCAIRQGIPVVLAGNTLLNPYDPWAAAVVARDADPVPVLEHVAEHRLGGRGGRAARR